MSIFIPPQMRDSWTDFNEINGFWMKLFFPLKNELEKIKSSFGIACKVTRLLVISQQKVPTTLQGCFVLHSTKKHIIRLKKIHKANFLYSHEQ